MKFLIAMVILCGTGAAQSKPKVVFYGDSTTYNWQLKQNSNAFQVNANWNDQGQRGATSSELLARFPTDVVSFHPAVVQIIAGTYDLLDACPASQGFCGTDGSPAVAVVVDNITANITAMAALAKKHNIKVILGFLPPVTLDLNDGIDGALSPIHEAIAEVNDWVQQYGAANNITVVNYHDPLCSCQENWRSPYAGNLTTDGITPSASGYAAMTPLTELAIALVDGLTVRSGYLGAPNNQNTVSVSSAVTDKYGNVTSTNFIQFTAYAKYSDGVTRAISGEIYSANNTITWTSSNPAVLTVYSSGFAVALTPGIARVSAAIGGKHLSPWDVTVTP